MISPIISKHASIGLRKAFPHANPICGRLSNMVPQAIAVPQGNGQSAFQETDAPVLEVGQCSADVFRAVLAHIYTGRSAPNLSDVWDLTAVAEFYMLSGLQASPRLTFPRPASCKYPLGGQWLRILLEIRSVVLITYIPLPSMDPIRERALSARFVGAQNGIRNVYHWDERKSGQIHCDAAPQSAGCVYTCLTRDWAHRKLCLRILPCRCGGCQVRSRASVAAIVVQDACAAFFSEQLRSREAAAWAATQVPRIWAWAEFASRDALARDCREFACRQFPEVARSSGAVL